MPHPVFAESAKWLNLLPDGATSLLQLKQSYLFGEDVLKSRNWHPPSTVSTPFWNAGQRTNAMDFLLPCFLLVLVHLQATISMCMVEVMDCITRAPFISWIPRPSCGNGSPVLVPRGRLDVGWSLMIVTPSCCYLEAMGSHVVPLSQGQSL